MEFKSEDLNVTFEVSEPVRGRDMLKFDEAIETGEDLYGRMWKAVCKLARNWQSEHIPDLDYSVIDEIVMPDDHLKYKTLKWACLEVFNFFYAQRKPPEKK